MQNGFLTAERPEKSPTKCPSPAISAISVGRDLLSSWMNPPVWLNDYGDTSLLSEEGKSGSPLS